MESKWMLYTKRAEFEKISARFNISPVLARIIINRDIKEEDFFTSAMAAAKFIAKNYPEKKCFMLGESGLEEALKEWNFDLVQENPDFTFCIMGIHSIFSKI